MCKGLEDYAKEVAAEAVAAATKEAEKAAKDAAKAAQKAAQKAAGEAAIQASIEAWQEVEISKEDILARLERKYQLDEHAALDYFEKYSLQTV